MCKSVLPDVASEGWTTARCHEVRCPGATDVCRCAAIKACPGCPSDEKVRDELEDLICDQHS